MEKKGREGGREEGRSGRREEWRKGGREEGRRDRGGREQTEGSVGAPVDVRGLACACGCLGGW